MNGAQILVRELEGRGVRHIFGFPGDEVYFFEALRSSAIDFVVARHEQAAAFMADVYARVSGGPSVCFSTLGPGATNLVTGIANAYLDRSPVIALSDQVDSDQLLEGVHQYIDLEALFRPVTKWSTTVMEGGAIPTTLDRAFRVAMAERRGPVHLSLPIDVLRREAVASRTREVALAGATAARIAGGASLGLEEFVALLRGARTPVAIVGNLPARAGATAHLLRLLEACQIPVMTTYLGKGVVPEDHPLSLGVLSRHAGRQLDDVFGPADLVVTFGFDYVEGVKPSIWKTGRAKTTVCVDCIPDPDLALAPADAYLIGELGPMLAAAGLAMDGHAASCWLDVPQTREAIKRRIYATASCEGSITPQAAIDCVREATDGGAIVVGDVGLNKYAVGLCYSVVQPGTVIFSNGLSSLGFSLPGAIGAKMARPEAQVVSISGDGGFLMNVQELETSVRRGLPVVAVVLRDDSLGLIKRLQENHCGQSCAVDFGNPDLPALARSFGALGFGVDSVCDLPAALSAALASGKTAVIDVPIDYTRWLC